MRRAAALLLLVAGLTACSDDDGDDGPPPEWQAVHEELDGALLSVWGSAPDDVWTVGGDPGDGPMALHWDGAGWQTLDAGSAGDLWWVFGFAGGPVYLGGGGGRILRGDAGGFTEMTTPSGGPAVFGIWGCSPSDVWAVGGNIGGGSGGFAWHLEGDEWVEVALPDGEDRPVWKVVGKSCDDVRFVGEAGLSLAWDGDALSDLDTGIGESLFTAAVAADCYLAVGGISGIVLEDCGGGWEDVSPSGAPGFIGVCTGGGDAYATGQFGAVYRREEDGTWVADDQPPTSESLHACWVDPSGGLWAAGGQVLAFPLVDGVLIYRGDQELTAAEGGGG